MDHVYHPAYSRIHFQKEKAVKKGIAFFDFDGTLSSKDSLLEFIKFSKGNFRFFFGFLLLSPWLLALKFRLISNQRAKEKVLRYFFNGTPVGRFNETGRQFAGTVIPSIIRPGALREIKKLKENNIEIVVVSASPENWLTDWTHSQGLTLISTRLVETDDKVTGMIEGFNCHGEEKVRRIREQFDLSAYDEIYAYGDSSGDRPMLALARHAFYKPFR
ncbi:MAG: haloacid dehalogenase-like hydrolase [Sphingobacteriales bacterium]|nr:haloacid dehalogenase-like hydrolase [Sphingobacteriales bacterium]